MNKISNTINQLFNNSIKPKLQILDIKFQSLIPNPKLRKILYISLASLFSFMFLIIILGLILSPFRKGANLDDTTLNKPKIVVYSPTPEAVLTETQQQLLDLENEIRDLKFPESTLTIPIIESDINI